MARIMATLLYLFEECVLKEKNNTASKNLARSQLLTEFPDPHSLLVNSRRSAAHCVNTGHA
jgi:hypothetical protein